MYCNSLLEVFEDDLIDAIRKGTQTGAGLSAALRFPGNSLITSVDPRLDLDSTHLGVRHVDILQESHCLTCMDPLMDMLMVLANDWLMGVHAGAGAHDVLCTKACGSQSRALDEL